MLLVVRRLPVDLPTAIHLSKEHILGCLCVDNDANNIRVLYNDNVTFLLTGTDVIMIYTLETAVHSC